MANQTRQLAGLLAGEGVRVEVVRQNRPYAPRWIGRIPWVRSVARLVPYAVELWRRAGPGRVVHVMANSGWSWHLFAAPAVILGRARGAAVVVNYRGGLAEEFFRRSYARVAPVLRMADAVVVPSGFLEEVFRRRGVGARVVPNIIDLGRFDPGDGAAPPGPPHLLVARNLEPIYDNATALRALGIVRERVPEARMTIAGTGPEEARLRALADELGLRDAVDFAGHVDNARMPSLYRSASVAINPSRADNMPISVLESLAAGVPVVSTDVGGVPFLVEHGRTALLVPPGDARRMAQAVLRILTEAGLGARLVRAGREAVGEYAWESVRGRWLAVYDEAMEAVARRHPRAGAGASTGDRGRERAGDGR